MGSWCIYRGRFKKSTLVVVILIYNMIYMYIYIYTTNYINTYGPFKTMSFVCRLQGAHLLSVPFP